jgi:hypothetical protein
VILPQVFWLGFFSLCLSKRSSYLAILDDSRAVDRLDSGLLLLVLSFVQLFMEIFYPEKFYRYALYLARFWGRALLYVLSGIILVVIGNGNLNGGPSLMCFIVGILTFALGCVFLLIAIVSCGKWNPVSLCRRYGKERYGLPLVAWYRFFFPSAFFFPLALFFFVSLSYQQACCT